MEVEASDHCDQLTECGVPVNRNMRYCALIVGGVSFLQWQLLPGKGVDYAPEKSSTRQSATRLRKITLDESALTGMTFLHFFNT